MGQEKWNEMQMHARYRHTPFVFTVGRDVDVYFCYYIGVTCGRDPSAKWSAFVSRY